MSTKRVPWEEVVKSRQKEKTTEARAILSHTQLFAKMDPEALNTLLSECRRRTFSKGDTIENDEGLEWFNIVIDGQIKLQQTDPITGRSFVSFLLERGDVFDVIALLDGEKHITIPIAVMPTVLLRVPMRKAREWLKRYPRFNEALLPYLGKQMRHLESFAESVVFDDTATRLARLILRHARPKGEDEKILTVEHLSHELLAEMIGSVRSVVTTQLNKLKNEGLIFHRRGKIIVENLEKLIQRYGL